VPVLKESAPLRYFTFFYLYTMQGIPAGFALTAINNYLIGKGLTAEAVGTFVFIVGIPWFTQFAWGPLIDKYQYSVIGHRKQWVVLTQLVAFLASLLLLLVHDPVAQLSLVSFVFFVHSNFASIQDASVDAIAISVVPEAERGRVNAFMRAGYLMGIACGAAGLAQVLHRYGFYYAALGQSLALLAMTVLTFFIRFDRADRLVPIRAQGRPAGEEGQNPPLAWVYRELWAAITEPRSLRLFGIIALGYLASGVAGRAYTYHLIHTLHWPDKDVSVLQGTWGSLITLGLLFGGGVLADRVGALRLQRWILLGVGVFLLSLCSLAGFWYLKPVAQTGLMLWSAVDPCLSVAALPLCMALCRQKIEGSQFTTYMALVNLCDVLGAKLNGELLKHTTAPVLGLACGGVAVGLFVLLWRTPSLPVTPASALSPAR
jgi:PAT family beta-lactamase induction signal transducer AmpG